MRAGLKERLVAREELLGLNECEVVNLMVERVERAWMGWDGMNELGAASLCRADSWGLLLAHRSREVIGRVGGCFGGAGGKPIDSTAHQWRLTPP
jgi:hypothetical protein